MDLLVQGIDYRNATVSEAVRLVNDLKQAMSAGSSKAEGAASIAQESVKLENLQAMADSTLAKLTTGDQFALQDLGFGFTRPGTALFAREVYSGQRTSHLDLARLHALDSGLTKLIQQLVQLHPVLVSMCAQAAVPDLNAVSGKFLVHPHLCILIIIMK